MAHLRRGRRRALPAAQGKRRERMPRDLVARRARAGARGRRRRLPAEAARSLSADGDGQGAARAQRLPQHAAERVEVSGRLKSGQARLDAVLEGGLPENAITLLIGLPGSGKTILAEQYVFANATPERPAIYLSTVSEPFDKLIRYGQTLSFFDAKAIGSSVFYEDLGG